MPVPDLLQKPFIPCEDDASFQLSHSMLWCHWTLTAQQKLRFPDVQWRIQKAVPGVGEKNYH